MQKRKDAEAAPPQRIAMLIYPGVAPLDVAGPLQVFGVCNYLKRRQLYDVITCAPDLGPIATRVGFGFMPGCAMEDLPLPVDTLLVSGGTSPDSCSDPRVFDWLRRVSPQVRRFGSICTGAFALAAAGLVTGKHVNTHWAMAEELARRHPEVVVEMDPIFVRDGNIYTTAGISAGIDLALALVEEDHGRAFALEAARYLVLPLKRSGGQAQFSMQLKAQFSAIPALQRVQQWILENLAGDLRIAALAKMAVMSERTFIRTFRQETGKAPGEFIATARLQAACRLLEETSLDVKPIAAQCGFGSAAGMRRGFLRALGVTPAQYRERFQRAPQAAA